MDQRVPGEALAKAKEDHPSSEFEVKYPIAKVYEALGMDADDLQQMEEQDAHED